MSKKATGNTGVRARCGRFVYAGQWVQFVHMEIQFNGTISKMPMFLAFTKGIVVRHKRRWLVDHRQDGVLTALNVSDLRHMRIPEIHDYLLGIHLKEHQRIVEKALFCDHAVHVRAHRRLTK